MENRMLEDVINLIPGGVFVYSAEEDEEFSFVSSHMLDMLGYTPEEFKAKFENRFSKMVYEEDREQALATIWEQISRGNYDTCRYRIEKKDGTLLWVHDEGHIISDETGKRWFYVTIADVDKFVGFSDELSRTNVELRTLIDSVPASIIVFRGNGPAIGVEAVNGHLCRSTGKSSDYFLPLSLDDLTELIHPEDRRDALTFLQDIILHEGRTGSLTYRVAVDGADGYKWYQCSAVSMVQDGVMLVYTVFTDATFQKKQEDDFNSLIDELLISNPDALFSFRLDLTDDRCRGAYGSAEYMRRLAAAETAEQMLSSLAGLIIDGKTAASFRDRFSTGSMIKEFRGGNDRLYASYRILAEDGEIHWIESFFHITENPYNNHLEAIVYSEDAEDEHNREVITAHITAKDYDYIGLIDTETRMCRTYVNEIKDVLKKEDEVLAYEDGTAYICRKNIPADEQEYYCRKTDFRRVIETLEVQPEYSISYFYIDEKGRKRRKQLLFRYLEDDRRKVMVTRTDITEAFMQEEKYSERLKEALREAERANRMKSDFVGNVSHDMRTPLNAIMGYNRLALSTRDIEKKDEYLKKIDTASVTLLSLINDTLDLQKIENGTSVLKPEPVSCSSVISELITSIRPMMEKKNIELIIDNSRAVMATINVDSLKVREIFLNLISNAAKFTPEGGRVELIVECVKLEEKVVHDRIIVRDNGIGMSKEFLERAFEPFAQERTKENEGIEGSGLGLTIVDRIVKMMGGMIEVKSEPGKGSEFTVYLDFERADVEPEHDRKDLQHNADISGVKVLLCDDNNMNREIARTILDMNGAETDEAAGGRECVEKFTASAPGDYDVILMDIRMPDIDGYTAAQMIRASGHECAETIPIIAVTADAYADDVKKALDSGMNGHISKPVDPEVMIGRIALLVKK
ncbi:MAG: PAS domain-containing protein [Eubacteriaceae bacterium]|jgi:PAS domain S-box-containing protein|nr:PAS domain-containing protein [Eubacteriaceae bacterium]